METETNEQKNAFESLTTREMDILMLLAEGLSDQEIADRLTVAYTTVKWYNRQIFNKLGVEKRRQAIERARQLGLLDARETVVLRRYKLPKPATPFVGRKKNLDELLPLIRDDHRRLVTVLAPGGMGKTRLALAAAEQLLADFANGVYFVSLAPLTNPDQIVNAIIETTGYPVQQDKRSPKQQLLDFLSDKTMLLVLDNYEHLLDGAPLVNEILQAAPEVQILTTSREKLNLSGETIYGLGGMSYPDDSAAVGEEFSAVALFEQCARRAQPSFAIEPNAASITRICQLVDGMPLAIELAAGWLEVLNPDEIADEIQRGIDFLESEKRDTPERHRSIRVIFDSTWARLNETEKSVFCSMTIFRNGCTREAARQVAGADVRTLAHLVDKSLLWHTPDGRYHIHELLRQYGAEQLEKASQTNNIRSAHAAYYAAFAAECDAAMKGKRQLESLREMDADFDNIRAAWAWALENRQHDAIDQMVESLYTYCTLRNHRLERQQLFRAAAETLKNQSVPMLWARAAARIQDYTDSSVRPMVEKALQIARQQHNDREIAFCLYQLGIAEGAAYQFEKSIDFYKQSLAVYRQLEDACYIANALTWIANNLIYAGHADQSSPYAEEAIAIQRQAGNHLGLANSLWILGGALDTIMLTKGGGDDVLPYFEEACAIFREMGDEFSAAAISSWHIAGHRLWNGELEPAYGLTDEGIRIMSEYHADHYKGRAIVTQAYAALIEEDYPRAKALAEEALPLIGAKHPIADNCRIVLAAEAAERGDHASVYPYVFRIFQLYLKDPTATITVVDELMIVARLLGHDGYPETAVGLIALVQHTAPHMLPIRYFPSWRMKLQEEMNADVYEAAWERGKTMDLKSVVQQLAGSIQPPEENSS